MLSVNQSQHLTCVLVMAEVQYNVWLDRGRFEDAERVYQEHLSKLKYGGFAGSSSTSASSQSVVSVNIFELDVM